ncbi:type II toxin-antitoxin system VapC family toxin [Dyadobacter jiangsuensis]|uniref:Putative nucleic acid-binding protein n=1 Tax=Dyadobacter jiangsuensis TaxID=1591085 RepID=A0A2P8FPC1_9BACT|nr:type II toxin-antitoxin system VapC family toxin [Dyadobacter jiangsuensis]PSL23578.1 putative nucleic acid-binding protein [Dyadobacter jiangsuensis]
MTYFDTDVLIHLLVPQDPIKHKLARNVFDYAFDAKKMLISFLALQEAIFVLYRLGQPMEKIEKAVSKFLEYQPVGYDTTEMRRAVVLGKQIGFQHINDCLHTAIAERHCNELYTFNKSDFRRIAPLSKLKVVVLE